jgi:inosose dehydratase
MSHSRRQFLVGLGATTAASAVPAMAAKLLETPERLYPPMDLAYFQVPISHGPSAIKFGYASITWDGKDRQAIDDISAVGYPGIQLRANALTEFPDPHALKDLLAKHHLTFVALSSDGDAPLDPRLEAKCIATHVKNARYLHEAGGKYLQVVGPSNKDQHFTAADYKREGLLLTEIAKRVSDFGIPVGFHNHMNTIAQTPEQLDAILDAADPRYVKLELDTGHYFQGGGDSAAAIHKYGSRLLFLHLKDVESAATHSGYQFTELGQGKVNFPAIFTALHDVHFRGWAVVELDDERIGVARSPKQSAEISKEYLTRNLGVSV